MEREQINEEEESKKRFGKLLLERFFLLYNVKE